MPGEASIKGFNTIIRGFGYQLRKDDEGTRMCLESMARLSGTLGIMIRWPFTREDITKGRLIRHLKCRIWQQREWEVHVLVAREDTVEVANLKKPFKK